MLSIETARSCMSIRTLSVLLAVAGTVGAAACAAGAAGLQRADSAIVTVYLVADPRGLMVTSGGWAYCLQLQGLARRSHFALLCGRYARDGYTGYGLRSRRRLDWGNPAYLASLAAKVEMWHKRIGGQLLLVGVSYSGFGVAVLASRHPELRPDRLIVIDSYLDLVARRKALPPTHATAREIDAETGGSAAELHARTVSIDGLARLVRTGTELTVIWSVSAGEQREFAGATCDTGANAGDLARLAQTLGRPVVAWVTHSRHGHDLWDHGREIIAGYPPGTPRDFRSTGRIPNGAVCR
jgi:pimeloyl-ACP methyl ester carboxylesterase